MLRGNKKIMQIALKLCTYSTLLAVHSLRLGNSFGLTHPLTHVHPCVMLC